MDGDVDRAIESVYLKLSSEDQNILLRAVGAEAAADPHREGGGEITFQAPNASDFHYLLGELPMEGKQLGWGDKYVASVAGTIHEFIRFGFADTQMGWMAYQAYQPVGACLLVASKDGMEARIGVLYVARSVRLRGVGRKLLENATSLAESSLFSEFRLWPQNARAVWTCSIANWATPVLGRAFLISVLAPWMFGDLTNGNFR